MHRMPAHTVMTGPTKDPTMMKVSTKADVGSRASEAAHPGSAGSSETCTVTPTSYMPSYGAPAGSRSHDVTDTALCESLRLQLVELGLGNRSRVEELFGRRDLIGA